VQVSGLGQSGSPPRLVLQDNGGDDLQVNADGVYTFATRVADGGHYTVTVQSSRPETCTVNHGSGRVPGADVTLAVTCSLVQYTIGGTVTGLTGTVVVMNDLVGRFPDTSSVSADGAFTFPTKLFNGDGYHFSVTSQPAGETCTVSGPAPKYPYNFVYVNGADVNVPVICNARTYLVAGVVEGLRRFPLLLRNNAIDPIVLYANGVFSFPTRLALGASYEVAVWGQPSVDQTCSVPNGVGSATSDVQVSVNCEAPFSIGGTVDGVTMPAILRNTLSCQSGTGYGWCAEHPVQESITLSANGGFVFPTGAVTTDTYLVEFIDPPPFSGQICSIDNPSGTIGRASITSVAVHCRPRVHDAIGGTLSGLNGTLVLQDNGGDDLVLTSSGAFAFPTKLLEGSQYAVTVRTQPAGQMCTVAHGVGIAGQSDVANIAVVCAAPWAAVWGGAQHSLGLRTDGTLWAWGDNSSGQLGTGGGVQGNVPARVGTRTWQSASGGATHTLAIDSNGKLWAWGDNGKGQLGTGTPQSQAFPQQVGTAVWKSVAAAGSFSIGIQADGTLWAWGDNSRGQLGIGNTDPQTTPVRVGASSNWNAVAAAGSITTQDIGQGTAHVIAASGDGTLWSWGSNDSGQLGTGDPIGTFVRTSPTQIGVLTSWRTIAAGFVDGLSIQTNGSLWGWGSNYFYALGVATLPNPPSTNVPVQAVGAAWRTMAAGSVHTLATRSDGVTPSEGTLWSWGWGEEGELGVNVVCDWLLKIRRCSIVPVQVGTATNWRAVAAGSGQSLALRADGTLWAWGINGHGQLGLGDGSSVVWEPNAVPNP
jgi:hypothetical protein